MYFRNVAGPGVFQSSVQQTCALQERQITKTQSEYSHGLSFVPLAFLWNACLLNNALENARSDFVFEQSRLHYNFFLVTLSTVVVSLLFFFLFICLFACLIVFRFFM